MQPISINGTPVKYRGNNESRYSPTIVVKEKLLIPGENKKHAFLFNACVWKEDRFLT